MPTNSATHLNYPLSIWKFVRWSSGDALYLIGIVVLAAFCVRKHTLTYCRFWALYLGRPHCIRLSDVTVPRIEDNHTILDPDLLLSASWVGLLEILGQITELL